jgi:hypothetical protein
MDLIKNKYHIFNPENAKKKGYYPRELLQMIMDYGSVSIMVMLLLVAAVFSCGYSLELKLKVRSLVLIRGRKCGFESRTGHQITIPIICWTGTQKAASRWGYTILIKYV